MLTIKTPVEYVSQKDVIQDAGKYIKKYGAHALIIGSKTPLTVVGQSFYNGLEANGIKYHVAEFKGYPTLAVIDHYVQQAKSFDVDFIIGIGGGKVCDTAKVVGSKTVLPVVTIPTIAATCAAWAACSILYQEDGDFDTVFWNEETPRLIIADAGIIARAPSRYLCAGIVDTLAKWYETEPNLRLAGDNITLKISLSGAKIAFDILKEQGQKVIEDGKKNIITKATYDTIDAVIYLAGFVGSFTEGSRFYGGFAHPFYYGTTRLANTRHMLHGEKVALGLLVQFVLERKPVEYIVDAIKLFDAFHLALTTEDIGIDKRDTKQLDIIATSVLKDFPGFTSLGYGRTTEEIVAAIIETDRIVKQELKNETGNYKSI
jgi:glycerol dehydrogenase